MASLGTAIAGPLRRTARWRSTLATRAQIKFIATLLKMSAPVDEEGWDQLRLDGRLVPGRNPEGDFAAGTLLKSEAFDLITRLRFGLVKSLKQCDKDKLFSHARKAWHERNKQLEKIKRKLERARGRW